MGERARVVMYGTAYCPYCTAARMLFARKNVEIEEISVFNDSERRAEMLRLSGRHTVPQIFIDGEPVGGFDEVNDLDERGELDRLLGRA